MGRTVFIAARLLATGFLAWALARHPIGYYTVLRIGICTLCLYAVYVAVQWNQLAWAFPFGAFALVFNPIVSLRMTRQTWAYVDVLTALFLLVTILLFRPNKD